MEVVRRRFTAASIKTKSLTSAVGEMGVTFLATKPKGDCGKTNQTYAPSGFPHGTLYLLAVFIQMYLTLCMNACFHHQGGSPVNSQWAGQNNIIKEWQSKQCIQMEKVFLNVH